MSSRYIHLIVLIIAQKKKGEREREGKKFPRGKKKNGDNYR